MVIHPKMEPQVMPHGHLCLDANVWRLDWFRVLVGGQPEVPPPKLQIGKRGSQLKASCVFFLCCVAYVCIIIIMIIFTYYYYYYVLVFIIIYY